MSARALFAAAALASALCLVACADDPPAVTPHGLEVVPFPSDAHGEAVPTYDDVRPGAWRATVRKRWTEVRDGGTPRRGQATLHLHVETTEHGDGLETHVRVEVAEADGVAEEFVRRFDGVEVRLRHDTSRRPVAKAARLAGSAPPGTETFLRGFWLAGMAGATPWFPAGPLSAGESWPRAHLGEQAYLATLPAFRDAPPRLLGGGRVTEVVEEAGETWLRVELDGLVEAETARGHEAVSAGLRDRGEALFRARDGLPRSWTLRQDVRIHHRTRGLHSRREVTLEVEGELTPVTSDSR